MLYEERWLHNINNIPRNSNSGGRLSIYCTIKFRPIVEPYVITCDSGRRRIMAGLRTGCLPLAVEVSRYTSTPLVQRLCQVCRGGMVEDQAHFLLYCPCLNIIRSNLFVYCNQINSKFISVSLFNKLHFLLTTNNKRIAHFLFDV